MTTTIRLNLLKAIAILIFIVAAASLLHPVFAEDASSSTSRKDKIPQRITTVKEKMASREAALKAKLATFRDKKKAEIADRVNNNLNKINQNQTNEMKKHLDKMSTLLDKLEVRINSGSSDIKDKTAIANTRAVIASATAAVTAQSQKDYTLQVTSESKVKADAQALRTQLKTDLLAVRKTVIDAKQAVANAIRTAKSGKVKEGTTSGQQ